MPGPFTVTAATNSVRLDVDRRSETSFTAFNASGRPIRGRAQLVPQNLQASDWLSLGGEAERDFAIAEAHQYTVNIAVPPDAPAGSYLFRLDVVGVENPDEQYTEGPTVTFQVPEPQPEKPFPWWIVAVVAAGLLLIGGLIAAIVLWPRDVEVPGVRGAAINVAVDELAEAHLEVSDDILEEPSAEVPEGSVIRTDPPAGDEVPRGTEVTLIVSTGAPEQELILNVDPEMSGVRLVGACASGVQGETWLETEGIRVGVSPVEDCPPPSAAAALLTFDISSLGELTLVQAALNLSRHDVIGDPFAEFGPLIVEEVSFPALTPGAVVLETALGELTRLSADPGEIEVTQALGDAVDRGSRRFQVRLEYDLGEIDIRDTEEALSTPAYYLVWEVDAITLDLTVQE
ncbi:MAG: PASTA domain-containing protein [Anaerolineae bacterium]